MAGECSWNFDIKFVGRGTCDSERMVGGLSWSEDVGISRRGKAEERGDHQQSSQKTAGLMACTGEIWPTLDCDAQRVGRAIHRTTDEVHREYSASRS